MPFHAEGPLGAETSPKGAEELIAISGVRSAGVAVVGAANPEEACRRAWELVERLRGRGGGGEAKAEA